MASKRALELAPCVVLLAKVRVKHRISPVLNLGGATHEVLTLFSAREFLKEGPELMLLSTELIWLPKKLSA